MPISQDLVEKDGTLLKRDLILSLYILTESIFYTSLIKRLPPGLFYLFIVKTPLYEYKSYPFVYCAYCMFQPACPCAAGQLFAPRCGRWRCLVLPADKPGQ